MIIGELNESYSFFNDKLGFQHFLVLNRISTATSKKSYLPTKLIWQCYSEY